MNQYNTFKNELLQISRNLSSLFSIAASMPEIYAHSLEEWEKRCSEIQKQISEEMVRVAVVGPIKSGKSTFVNALFGGDYLKRGAGVVTSIVTRIRSTKDLKAHLYFKSWDEIERDMARAMTLFPSQEWRSKEVGSGLSPVGSSLRLEPTITAFDIREEADRTALRQALDALNTDMLISRDTRNMNSLLLSAYLKGYDRVKKIPGSDTVSRCYENKNFAKHKDFVGDDNLSVYLKDVLLEIPCDNIDTDTEIADCQGSDSPNPFHLAMIQDYLLLTHLIIYVISSRTGLRQADIRFLSIIRKMGILDNILFVINIDFGEHESVDELNPLILKIKEDIALIKPDPQIYTFSALFNLFESKPDKLSDKERERLVWWKKERELVELSDQETERFYAAFHHKIKGERYFLLLKNHLERLGVISSHAAQWISMNQDILVRDASGVNEMMEKITQHQKQIDKIKSMIKSTFDGAVHKVRQELKGDVDRFFDPRYGDVLRRVIDFIRNYTIDSTSLRLEPMIPPFSKGGLGGISEESDLKSPQPPFKKGGLSSNHVGSSHRHEPITAKDTNSDQPTFSNHMYLAFQDFKQALDMFMAESINPEIIRFVREEENRIRENLELISGSYDKMVQDALAEYERTLESVGIHIIPKTQNKIELPDMNSIKKRNGLTLLPAAASMNYGMKIKTEAVMRLGIHRIFKTFKKLFKRPLENEREDQIAALKESISRLKKETEKSLVFHFKDYSENMKYQYIFKMVDVVSGILYDMLLDRFQTYASDLSSITARMDEKQIDKEQVSQILNKMKGLSQEITEQINQVREEVAQLGMRN